MKIVSLDPSLTELVFQFGLGSNLVGVTARCDMPVEALPLPKVTGTAQSSLKTSFSWDALDLDILRGLSPDLILGACYGQVDDLAQMKEEFKVALGIETKLGIYNPRSLDLVYEMFEALGKDLGLARRGYDLAQRAKAQFMDWADNFYERTKNKKVSFLNSIDPLRLGGLWLPDMIQLCSAHSQQVAGGSPGKIISWQELLDYRPDVLVVAPEGLGLKEAMGAFKILEKLPEWETIPAVKRGEVVFTDGAYHFHRIGPGIINSMAILVSAIAGLESGYITPRDSFYRLRWLELQRHKL